MKFYGKKFENKTIEIYRFNLKVFSKIGNHDNNVSKMGKIH